MDIEILNFRERPCSRKIGCVLVKYHDLSLKCDVVYYAKAEKIWIRMPENWIKPKVKFSYCYWDKKRVSDDFQKEVLNKLESKYSLDVKKAKKLHADALKAMRSKKKPAKPS